MVMVMVISLAIMVFNPNKTATFYHLVFLDATTLKVGKENMLRTNLMITDEDGQKFKTLDGSIYLHFKVSIKDRYV